MLVGPASSGGMRSVREVGDVQRPAAAALGVAAAALEPARSRPMLVQLEELVVMGLANLVMLVQTVLVLASVQVEVVVVIE